MPSVAISRRFFVEALKDYSDWQYAFIREFFQNAIDCKSNTVTINVNRLLDGDGDTNVEIINDGRVMSREVLEGKLLTLGETTKGDDETGGFGVAKTILYFAHIGYTIHSGNTKVCGNGGSYDVHIVEEKINGTYNRVTLSGDQVEDITNAVLKFAQYGQWNGTIILNGERHECKLKKGAFRRDLGFAKVYTNNSYPYRLVVRAGGQPMFVETITYKKCVIVELDDPAKKYLTSNRDGLTYPYRSNLSSFIQELASDGHSALSQRDETTYTVFDGLWVTKAQEKAKKKSEEVTEAEAEVEAEVEEYETAKTVTEEGVLDVSPEAQQVRQAERVERNEPVAAYTQVNVEDMVESPAALKPVPKRGPDGYRFVLKNTTSMKVPRYLVPGSMSSYGERVLRYYRKCVQEAMRQLNVTGDFSVGFLLSDDTEGQFEPSSRYGSVFFINPMKVVSQKYSNSRSFKLRYKLNAAGKWAIASVAIHEVCHALQRKGGWGGAHDETFSLILTQALAKALQNRKDYASCFS